MIKVYGSARRTFNFPADLPTAYAYCSDVERILTYLPHIFLVQAYAVDQFRMLYSTLELGVYHIRIFCDLRTTLDVSRDRRAIHISPLTDVTPVLPKASASTKSPTASSSARLTRSPTGWKRCGHPSSSDSKARKDTTSSIAPAQLSNPAALAAFGTLR
jgi:hypothetical protein